MEIAREMIMTAATYCKADVVKFQKRCNKELLTFEEEYNAPHPHPENSYGLTYGAHREFLEFNLDICSAMRIPAAAIVIQALLEKNVTMATLWTSLGIIVASLIVTIAINMKATKLESEFSESV